MNSPWQKIGFLPSSSEMPEPRGSLCCLLCLSMWYVMSAPFLCKQVTPFKPQCLVGEGSTFFLLKHPWPPFGSRWIQTSQTAALACWYVSFFPCIGHSTKHKWGKQPLMKSCLFPFLSKFPLNFDQEENGNFIPRIHENLGGGEQFFSHSTVTAPHSSHPVSRENYKLSVYWSVLGDKSRSSSLGEWVSLIAWQVWPGAELACSLCPTSPWLRAQLFASLSALPLHPAPLVTSQAKGKRWQDKTLRIRVAIFAEVWLSHHFHIKATTREKAPR